MAKASKSVPAAEYSRMKRFFEGEIERKDKMIGELKKENLLLLKISLKRSKEMSEIKERLGKGR